MVWQRKPAPCRPEPKCLFTSLTLGLTIGLTIGPQVHQPPFMQPLPVPECCAPRIACAAGGDCNPGRPSSAQPPLPPCQGFHSLL